MKNQKVATVLGTAIIIIFAITVGMFVLKIEKTKRLNQSKFNNIVDMRKTDQQRQVQSQQNQEEEKRITEQTKDWFTYNDENYGIEFKYPKDHYVKSVITSDGSYNLIVTSKKKYPGDKMIRIGNNTTIKTIPNEITIAITNTKGRSVDYIKKSLEGNIWDRKSGKGLIVDNNDAFYYESSVPSSVIYIVGKERIYLIEMQYLFVSRDIFKGVYSTFKEINKATL